MNVLLNAKTRPHSALTVPVLELPGIVLLPQGTIPVHFARLDPEIKRALVRKDSSGNSGVVLVIPSDLTRPGISPADFGTGCLAKMETAFTSFREDHFEEGPVMLRGTSRAKYYLRSGNTDESQLAEVVPCADEYRHSSHQDDYDLRQQLIRGLIQRAPELALREMSSLLECELPLGQLCDLAAPLWGLNRAQLQEFIQEPHVLQRCRLLLRQRTGIRIQDFPALPAFGMN